MNLRNSDAAPLVPNDVNIAGNLLVWLTDPASTYDEATGVWTDSSGNGNSTETFVGNKASLEFEPFLLESESVEFGLLADKDVSFVLSTEADDSLRTPHLNDGVGFGALTILSAVRYGDLASNNRPLGIGSFHDDDLRPGLQPAGDGSIRRDNGFLAGTSAIPEDFFVRATILDGDGAVASDATLTDVYFDENGPLINMDSIVFDPDNALTADDRLYLGDLRNPFANNAIAQVAVYNTALSLEEVTDIAEWMTANPNGFAAPEEIMLGDFDDNGAVELADFLILANNFNQSGRFPQGDMDFNGQVDLEDFFLFRNVFNPPVAAASVPEPSSRFLILVSAILLPLLRRCHKNKPNSGRIHL